MTTTLPPEPTYTPRGVVIDPRLGAAALRAPAAPLLKPSSNSSVPVAWIRKPATESR